MKITSEIKKALEQLCEDQDLTSERLGLLVGVSQRTANRWLNGEAKKIHESNWASLSPYLIRYLPSESSIVKSPPNFADVSMREVPLVSMAAAVARNPAIIPPRAPSEQPVSCVTATETGFILPSAYVSNPVSNSIDSAHSAKQSPARVESLERGFGAVPAGSGVDSIAPISTTAPQRPCERSRGAARESARWATRPGCDYFFVVVISLPFRQCRLLCPCRFSPTARRRR